MNRYYRVELLLSKLIVTINVNCLPSIMNCYNYIYFCHPYNVTLMLLNFTLS